MPLPTDETYLDITPTTEMIYYMRQQNLTWFEVIKEFVDNAVDQAASRVTIEFTAGQSATCIVEDNGKGCANLSLLVHMAARADTPSTRIGRYGIGAKDGAVWAAKEIHIHSVCEEVRSTLSHDWERLRLGQRWQIVRPMTEPAPGEPSGFRLELRKLLHRPPDRIRLLDELARTYMPWLSMGGYLGLKMGKEKDFTPVEPSQRPSLLHAQTETLIYEGKSVEITLGLIPPASQVPWSGVLCLYGPRVITQKRRLGIPPDAIGAICGWAEFSRDWGVEKNKRDFTDDLTPLEAMIADRFADLFAQASHQQMTQPQEALREKLNQRLKRMRLPIGPLVRNTRPGPRDIKEGTIVPTDTGPPHRDGKNERPGPTRPQRRSMSMNFVHMGPEGPRCEKVSEVVTINLDHPDFTAAIHDMKLLEERIAETIAIYLATEWNDPQLELRYKDTEGPAERIFAYKRDLLGQSIAAQVMSSAAAD